MKKLLTLILILISFTLSAQWTVREDTLTSTSGDVFLERWEGLQTPHPNGILLKLKYTEYFVHHPDTLVIQARESYKIFRTNNDTVGDGQVTIQWLKDQTFVNRNYVKQWAQWEIEKLLEEQRQVPDLEEL